MRAKYFNALNIVFVIAVTLTLLIAFAYLPRFVAFAVLALYLGYIVLAPAHKGAELVVRSIPFFIALPITRDFDNFNMWRLVVAVLFVRFVAEEDRWRTIVRKWRRPREAGVLFVKRYRLETAGIVYFTIAAITIYVAPDTIAAVKRLVYLVNAAVLFVVVRALIQEKEERARTLMANFAFSGIVVVGIGFIQFFSAYFAPAWVFHYWWGSIVSEGFYGRAWAGIVTDFGNTWFSYSGATLRLRMFSLFPDSHSFPTYVILTIPALVAVAFSRVASLRTAFQSNNYRHLLRTYSGWAAAAGFGALALALILSGTRGIWVSALFVVAPLVLLRFVHGGRVFVRPLTALLLIFILMFPLYFGILTFRQFQDTDFEASASFSRLRSIIDFGEASNQGRLYIWKETSIAIARSPLWGVGIGNYPVVLQEPLSAARAGASAHNLYLHVASTIGVFGLGALFAVGFEVVRISIRSIRIRGRSFNAFYFAGLLFAFAWIAGYSLTDAALFDGRALLGFMVALGIAAGLYSSGQRTHEQTR